MKKLSLFTTVLLLLSFTTKTPVATLTDSERKYATDLLLQTEAGVINAAAGLSEAQLNFKPAPDKWSVADCIKHIAVTEAGLWQMTNGTIQAPANPEKRSEVKATDEQVVNMIEDRSHKVKTATQLEPQNTPYKSMEEAMMSFIKDRSKLISYVKTTDVDLRNHVGALPVGSFDSYQMILFIAAHSNRHMQQMEEVKADPNFPKN
ncbi:MAG TPA: DinB family protein [Panacibacter sp.]|nr:DinB family protein [Panacibacter sp.]HNP46829.1 DinB family protein [Panacibacter sp.]